VKPRDNPPRKTALSAKPSIGSKKIKSASSYHSNTGQRDKNIDKFIQQPWWW
jgi:hypothetical protein